MLLMIEERIRGRMCEAVYKYDKANNKYMKNYEKNIETPHLMYLDANKFYGKKLTVILWRKITCKWF